MGDGPASSQPPIEHNSADHALGQTPDDPELEPVDPPGAPGDPPDVEEVDLALGTVYVNPARNAAGAMGMKGEEFEPDVPDIVRDTVNRGTPGAPGYVPPPDTPSAGPPPASASTSSTADPVPDSYLTTDSPLSTGAPPDDPPVFVPTEYAPDLSAPDPAGDEVTDAGTGGSWQRIAIPVAAVVTLAAVGLGVGLSVSGGKPRSSPPRSTAAAAPAAASLANPSGVRTPGEWSCPQPESTIFQNGNIAAVHNGGTPPTFSVGTPMCLGQIATYHWNKGAGSPGGDLWLVRESGDPGFADEVGPFSAIGGTTWHATVPNDDYPVVIQGTYECEDSDPATWSADKESGNEGFCFVFAYPATKVSSSASTTTTAPAS